MAKHGYEVTIKTGDYLPCVEEEAFSNGCTGTYYDEEEEYSSFLFETAEDALWFYIHVRDKIGYIRIDPVNIEEDEESCAEA